MQKMTAIQKPEITKMYENDNKLFFVIKNIPFCIANAIRRTILSDIPVVVIRTETSAINQCEIITNTTRFHNEIIKQRLSCIPIITKDIKILPKNYRLIVNVQNTSDYEMKWVTTDDFEIQHKESEQFIEKAKLKQMFPYNPICNRPIDFLRLRPNIGPTIPGEAIHLTAEFSVSTAKENGMFNAVSTCSYHNVVDDNKKKEKWAEYKQQYIEEGLSNEEIEFEEKNFNCLEAYRCYKTDENGSPNEFEFIIETIGQYTNNEIVSIACDVVKRKLDHFKNGLMEHLIPIHKSFESKQLGYSSVTNSTIQNSYDIILEEEDYTLGYILEHYLYTLFYLDDPVSLEEGEVVDEAEDSIATATHKDKDKLQFIGFKKYHPHDNYSVIRLASSSFTNDKYGIAQCENHLITACDYAIEIFDKLRKKFNH
jgi:DNA-directed RNA polymerase alpha subunit